jgi:hypothetical protein
LENSAQNTQALEKMYEEAEQSRRKYNEFRVLKLERSLKSVIDKLNYSFKRTFICNLREACHEEQYMHAQTTKILRFKKIRRFFRAWLVVARFESDERQCRAKAKPLIATKNHL